MTVFLSQGNERLDSVRVLVNIGHLDSAVIVTRSLFELAANLVYIANDLTTRLGEYLKHGGVPITDAEVRKLQEELERGDQPEVKHFIPGVAWKRLKEMCSDLGSNWLKEYETFYRYSSIPTHAGSFTLGKSYIELLRQQPASDLSKARVLATALSFHLRVAEITAAVFPEQVDILVIKGLTSECREVGNSLAIAKLAT